ncbi:MAG: hypothetical protein VW576_09110 [Opitutae bacterium]
MKLYFFFIILGLSIYSNILNGSSLTNEQRLESLDREIQEFQARIKALQDRYKNLGKKLEKPRHSAVQPDSHIEAGSDDFQNQIILDEVNENSSDGEAVTNEEIIYTNQNKNSFRFSYAICIPHDTDFANYKMEYHTGHSIGLTYSRHHDWFFWGLHLGAKFFESDKMSDIPLWGDLPASGNNYSTNFSLISGLSYNLNEKFYVQGNIGVGINHSWDEIQLGSTTVKYNEANLYGALGAGIGIQFSEFVSMLLFYEIDVHGDSGRLDSRVFSQLGLKMGFHY